MEYICVGLCFAGIDGIWGYGYLLDIMKMWGRNISSPDFGLAILQSFHFSQCVEQIFSFGAETKYCGVNDLVTNIYTNQIIDVVKTFL